MLRLNPTQLRLDARDLTWHIGRHSERQTLRTTGPPTNKINKTRSPKKNQLEARTHGSPCSFPQPSADSKAEFGGDKHEDSIISNEPVPHDSRSFWDRVLADAGTPTRTQTISQGNATVIEPSDDLLEINHSSRASIEEDHTNWQDRDDAEAAYSDDPQSPFRDVDAVNSSNWLIPSSSGSHESTRLEPSIDADKLDEEQNLLSEKVVKTAPGKRRLSFNTFNFFRRKVTPDLDGNTEANANHFLTHRDTDGPCESRGIHDRSRSEAANSGTEGDLHDGMYGSRRDRRTISASLEAYVKGRGNGEASVSKTLSNDAASRSVLPAVPSPQQLHHRSRHASGLPRSSLHISHAAVSSSPHKEAATTADHSQMPDSAGLLGLPPRRRKRYKPRSESYPFVSSEDLDMSALPQLDGSFPLQGDLVDLPSLTVSYPSTHNMVPTPPSGISAWDYHPFGASRAGTPDHQDYTNGGSHSPAQTNYEWSSPRESNHNSVEISSYQSLSSISSHHAPIASSSSHSQMGSVNPSPSRRNLSPFAEAFVPRSARRHASPQLPLPPPFSATPRNLSLNSAFPPSSSSVSPHTPPSRLPSSSSYSPSPVVIPHSHAHVPVYNDNISPTTQPQTPAEFSRNRRPPLASQNPFNTAPARASGAPGLTARVEGLANWQAFVTPTRGPSTRTRNFRDHEQENVGAVDAEERRWRREMAMGLRMGREEMERDGQR